MSENKTEVLVGGAVLAAAVGFVLYTGQATGFTVQSGGYPLTASFRSLEGVSVGTDVRFAGVKVGTVSEVSLSQETFRAEATMNMREQIKIPDDSAAVVSQEGLLGGNFVEIVPGGSPFFYEPGDEILDTQGAVSLISLLLKFVTGESE